MKPTPNLLLTTALLSVALAGCGIENPYDEKPDDDRTRTAPRVDALPPAPPDGELPGVSTAGPEPDRYRGAGTTPQATLRRAATLAGNWTSESAPTAYRALAALSTGDARAAFEQIAAGARADVQQAGAEARASATVEAVVVRGSGTLRHSIVVTHERVVSARLPDLPAEYRVTLATVRRRGDAWVIANWAPQP